MRDDDLLPTVWLDNNGRRLTCYLGVELVLNYCREQDIAFSTALGRRNFNADDLNAAQLFDLAYLGTRFNNASQQETSGEFTAVHESDGAFEDALFAARAAVINFTLRQRLPSAKRADAARILQEGENALRSRLRELTTETLGLLATFATPVSAPDSPDPATPGSPD